jgi:O-antigen/teichoic acid export membrane protein
LAALGSPVIVKNIVANYVGQGWRGLIGLALVPVYVSYLGVEAYGLVGVFAVMQAWLGLFDAGTRPVLSREMARYGAGAHDAQSIADLLRTVEIISVAIAVTVAGAVLASSGWLASEWLRPDALTLTVVAQAIAIMGALAALRFIENLYVSALVGLQRQVLENVIGSVFATVRAVGAVAVLAWVSPTIQAFFLWQALVSALAVGTYALAVKRLLPKPELPARFSRKALREIWRFALGMLAITVLALLLTQVDKILLARLLPLENFGYYSLAALIAGILHMLCWPITTAFYPRFTELATSRDEPRLSQSYHFAAQLLTVIVGATAIALIAFADRFLPLWTGDPALSAQIAPLLRVLTIGTLLNGLMWVPYHLQLAAGWTALSIKVNVVAVIVLVPTILQVVPLYGAIGAAWVGVALNASYIVFTIYFMHRRLLPADKWRWYVQDVLMPMLAAVAIAGACAFLMPADATAPVALALMALGSACIFLGAAGAAPLVRAQLLRYCARQTA